MVRLAPIDLIVCGTQLRHKYLKLILLTGDEWGDSPPGFAARLMKHPRLFRKNLPGSSHVGLCIHIVGAVTGFPLNKKGGNLQFSVFFIRAPPFRDTTALGLVFGSRHLEPPQAAGNAL